MPAEEALRLVLNKLADAALNRALQLYNVSDQVEFLRQDLRLIQAFLRDADSKRTRCPLAKQWVKEVRNVAYKIEDAVDTFLVEIEKNSPTGLVIVSRIRRLVMSPLEIHRLCEEIKSIRETLRRLHELRNQVGWEISDVVVGTGEDNRIPFRPSKLCDIDVSEVVGLDSDKEHILEHLLDRTISRRTVLSIVGIGGLGKTTLAQKVYKSSKLMGQFNCRIWLSISQKFNLNDLLRAILFSAGPHLHRRRRTEVTDDELPSKVMEVLSKKYLITLDDVWTVDLWDQLRRVLPDTNNGSRVIITSRSLDVAKAADCKTKPYKLPYLDEAESLALLFRKAFQCRQLPTSYPPNLIEVAKQLVKKCGGLPLALIVLGGILSRRERTYSAWDNVVQTMNWHSEEGEKCSQILAMSYDDLPYELKPCFLYFAAFPEDHEIPAQHVTRMWIAEGFIQKDGPGTLEDRAESYLEELVQRCLVQVNKKSLNGYCKYCGMHDLLRDLAIHESKEDNFFTVFLKSEDGTQQAAEDARRASLQFCTPTGYGVHSRNTRSLLCFGDSVSNYKGFRLLRVLVIERMNMSEIKVSKNWLEGMVHLRYLGFRYCGSMPKGFKSISFATLKNLETLDCKETFIYNNHSIWEVPTLRHVIVTSSSKIPCPLKWNSLKNLQTLKWVKLVDIPKLECNVNLRTLKINNEECNSIEEAWKGLEALLSRTEHLTSLTLTEIDGYAPFLTIGTRKLTCHEKIQSLRLYGRWARDICVPSLEMFPTNLTRLRLDRSRIEKDPMPILERLQSLRILQLLVWSFVGTKMTCSSGGFPSLQKLELVGMYELSQWEIKEGAMPILSHLTIDRCVKLHTVPQLHYVSTLQDLLVNLPSDALQDLLQSEDHYKIKNIRSVCITRHKC